MKIFITLLFLIAAGFQSNAQNINPIVQSMIDELNVWMQQEMQSKGSVDPLILSEKSARIKAVQDSLSAVKNPVQSASGTSVPAISSRMITKTLLAGSSLTVPSNVEWQIIGIYVKNDANPYRIQVKSIDYSKTLQPGEKITAPAMSSESALLTSDAMSASYDFEILESIRK